MSIHIGAEVGQIAPVVLMPGDPLRAQHIAKTFLTEVSCYNEIRGMLGFTGLYKGKKVSVQGSGMGMPSFSIYTQELIDQYGVKSILRVGSCGSFRAEVKIRDLILSMSASTDSAMFTPVFQGATFAPCASFELLKKAWEVAVSKKIAVHTGNILSTDIFYADSADYWKKWMDYGVLGVDMETAALYALAAKKGITALSLLTVSDHFITQEKCSASERQTSFNQMIEVALELI